MTLIIKNSGLDAVTTRIATEVFNTIPPQWRELLPPIVVTLTYKQLNNIVQLQPALMSKYPLWRDEDWREIYAVAPTVNPEEAEVWLRICRLDDPCDIELCRLLAKIMLVTAPDLHHTVKTATADVCETDEAVRTMFAHLFTQFVLRPQTLSDGQQPMWILMQDLDKMLLNGTLQRQKVMA